MVSDERALFDNILAENVRQMFGAVRVRYRVCNLLLSPRRQIRPLDIFLTHRTAQILRLSHTFLRMTICQVVGADGERGDIPLSIQLTAPDLLPLPRTLFRLQN